MNNILIDRISFSTYINPKNNCNFLKNPDDADIQHLDYDTEIAKTNLLNYAHLIDYKIHHIYTFTPDEISTLLECMNICIKVGRCSHLVDEDLEPIIRRLQEYWYPGQWFVRFNSCSPKDGIGSFPITTPRKLIEMIVTSHRAKCALTHSDDTLLFVPFDPTRDDNRELRVFIHHKKITAISQYNPYNLSYFSDKDDKYLHAVVNRIKLFLDPIIPTICSHVETNNLVCDIYLDHEDQPRIVEFNSFGYWLATGGVLFHWLEDKDKLYNTQNKIYLRLLT